MEFKNAKGRDLKNNEYAFLIKNQLKGFPFVIEASDSDGLLSEFINSEKQKIEIALANHGAILFRNFKVSTAEEFEKSLLEFGLVMHADAYSKGGGLTQRKKIKNNVYSSTETSNESPIYFHNEMAYANTRPTIISFYAHLSPNLYGETPISDGAKVYAGLSGETQQILKSHKLIYRRIYKKSNKHFFLNVLQASIKQAFGTEDADTIAKICQTSDFEHKWINDNTLQVDSKVSAVVTNPRTNSYALNLQLLSRDLYMKQFNMIKERHSFWKRWIMKLKMELYFYCKLAPISIMSDDGKPLPKKMLFELFELVNSNACYFKWQKDDVLLLDNTRCLHARLNVEGERKIYTCFGNMHNFNI